MAKKKTAARKVKKKARVSKRQSSPSRAIKKSNRKASSKKKPVKRKSVAKTSTEKTSTKKKSTRKKATKKKSPGKRTAKKTAARRKTSSKKTTKKPTKQKAAKTRGVKKRTNQKTTPKKKSTKSATKKKSTGGSSSTGKPSKPARKKSTRTRASKPGVSARSNGKPDGQSILIGGQATVAESPNYRGKPLKLERDTYPENALAADFQCFGPAAMCDGEFDSVRICDMGCFAQDGKDSNKYYHGAVVQHRKSKNWYAYFEWGRTGSESRAFQFVACQSEQDARVAFSKQLLTKNEKRGEWVTIAGIRTLRAKAGKDCYLVRPMATRTTGLPDARSIKSSQRLMTTSSGQSPCRPSGDRQTLKLLSDLRIATIAFTRKSMADSSVPTQVAIDQARNILGEASIRVAELEEDIEAQVADKALMQLTRLMFSRIPRKKRVGSAPALWMLTSQNIQDWHDDLNAFESALHAVDIELNPEVDILSEMNLQMNWIDPTSKVGEFLYDWVPGATLKQHQKINRMEIVNAWEVERRGAGHILAGGQKRILKSTFKVKDKPRHQPKTRVDLSRDERSHFKKTNTACLFHGTRSVNVNAILREALRMPETLVAVPITGAKFGPGIYFSDDWKKAADYTNAKGSMEVGNKGVIKGRHAFMFVADVVLGRPYVAPDVQGFSRPPRGHHSVFAKADHSGVVDNEFVVYETDQNRLRYLLEFKTT